MDSTQISELAKQILEDKKALNVEAIEVSQKTILADYFVIASGTSVTHVKSLADELVFQMKNQYNIVPDHTEGESTARWILLDFGDVVVHIFHPEERDFYSLEKLWQMSRTRS